MLDRDELVPELAHLIEGAIEDTTEPRRRLRLPAASDARQLREARLCLGAQRSRAVAGAVDERPRELLIEERKRQMIGRELRVAGAARELLCSGDRLLRLQGELLKIHVCFVGARLSRPYDLLAGCFVGRYRTTSRL